MMQRVVFSVLLKLMILFTLSSCAMQSGRYVFDDQQGWVFQESRVGILAMIDAAGTQASTDYSYVSSNAKFTWPLPGNYKISSNFGARGSGHHDGIDIPAKLGTSVIASHSGVVIYSGVMNGYGKIIIIDHRNGYHTVYAHNAKNLVRRNDRVKRKQTIAKVGLSGRTTGPHLHFEIKKNKKTVNPLSYFKKSGQTKYATAY